MSSMAIRQKDIADERNRCPGLVVLKNSKEKSVAGAELREWNVRVDRGQIA